MSLAEFRQLSQDLPYSYRSLNLVVSSLGASWAKNKVMMEDVFGLSKSGRQYIICENRYKLFTEMGLLDKYRIVPPYSGWKPKHGDGEAVPSDCYLLDLETTGYGPRYCGIAQMCLSPLHDPSSVFNRYVCRPYKMKKTEVVSGLTWNFLEKYGRPFPEIYQEALAFVPPGSIVSYYARGHFDRDFILAECARHRLEPPPWRWYQMYAHVTLSEAYEQCNGSEDLIAHRAEDDVAMFRTVFLQHQKGYTGK